jgi:hypothetical protein
LWFDGVVIERVRRAARVGDILQATVKGGNDKKMNGDGWWRCGPSTKSDVEVCEDLKGLLLRRQLLGFF